MSREPARSALFLLVGALAAAACSKSETKEQPACPGCVEGTREQVSDEVARFHHVHLMSADAAASRKYYQEFMGALDTCVGCKPALETERAFILIDQADTPPSSALETGIEHIGWATPDPRTWFDEATKRGLNVQVPPTNLSETFTFLYATGADGERVEVFTGQDEAFTHLHLMCDDVNTTTDWYRTVFQLPTRSPQARDASAAWTSNNMSFGVVSIEFFGPPYPVPNPFQPTEGHVYDHLAFSFRDLDAQLARLQQAGIEIVRPIAKEPKYGFRSFFVRAPNGVLIEIVEASELPAN